MTNSKVKSHTYEMKDLTACEAQRWFYGEGDACPKKAVRKVETTIHGEVVTLNLCEEDAEWIEDWDKAQIEANQKEAWEES